MNAGHAELDGVIERLIDGLEKIVAALGEDRKTPVALGDIARRGIDADELEIVVGEDLSSASLSESHTETSTPPPRSRPRAAAAKRSMKAYS